MQSSGMRQLAYSREFSGDESGIFDRDVLAFPEIEITPENGEIMQQMRPLLNVIWQAAGFDGSPNFNEMGDWLPPRH